MKHVSLPTILLAIVFSSCRAQVKNPSTDDVTIKLVGYYNHAAYDSIFHLFSQEMQRALPLNKTIEFFTGLNNEAGLLARNKFVDTLKNFSRYRADFDKGIFWLNIAVDKEGKIDGLNLRAYDGPDLAIKMTRNSTKLALPFSGEWFVFWGGDTKEQNYHVINRSQKNAFDLVLKNESGRSFKTDGKTNEDYYAFGQPLLAVCDAEVVSVIEGVKDNIPGQMNRAQVTGNTVLLKTEANEFILYAHFKLNSIIVKPGEKVKKGQTLGLCGNSGNSSEPHLHFHIQDKEFMSGSTGVKSYFENIKVNGVLKNDYSPVRGEKIQNAN